MLKGQTKPLALMEYEATENTQCICRYFACGRQLSLIEQLAGPYCTRHMKRLPHDPTLHVSYPSADVRLSEMMKLQQEIAALNEKFEQLKHPGSAKTSIT